MQKKKKSALDLFTLPLNLTLFNYFCPPHFYHFFYKRGSTTTTDGTAHGCTPSAATAGQSAGRRVPESPLERSLGAFNFSL